MQNAHSPQTASASQKDPDGSPERAYQELQARQNGSNAPRRGDGIADFMFFKQQFVKTRDEVLDQERRIKSLEELFHKQSIIQSSNEIVTTASLQNYLDAMTTHIEKQFSDKVKENNEYVQRLLVGQKEEVKLMIKDKANKHKIDRLLGHMNEQLINSSMKIDTIFTGLEMQIVKATAQKVEMADLEAIDKAKADMSQIKRLEEQLQRLEKMVQDNLRLREEESEAEEEDDLDEYDDEHDDLMEDEGGSPLNDLRKSSGIAPPTIETAPAFTLKPKTERVGSDMELDPEELKDQIYPDDIPHPVMQSHKLSLPPFQNSASKSISNSNSSENIKLPIPPSPLQQSSIAANDAQENPATLGATNRSTDEKEAHDINLIKKSSNEDVNFSSQSPNPILQKRFSTLIGSGDKSVRNGGGGVAFDERTQSSISSRRDSRFSRSKTSKQSGLKNRLTTKLENMIELDTIKKDIAECNNRVREVHDHLLDAYKPTVDFFNVNKEHLRGMITSYESTVEKMKEMESYDEQLKHKYLRSALQQVNEIKNAIQNEQAVFKQKQKEERGEFIQRVKVVETETDCMKTTVEYLKKVIQQHKFFGGCYALASNPAGVSQITSGGSACSPRHNLSGQGQVNASIENSLFLMTNEGAAASQISGKKDALQDGFGQISLIQPSLPHQITVLCNQVSQVQKDLEDVKKFTKIRVTRLTQDIEELRVPFNDTVSDLKEENKSLLRELDRLDQLQKQILNEYTEALKQNRDLLERQEEVQKRLASQNYINNATIQFFGTSPQTPQSGIPYPSTTPSTPNRRKTLQTPMKTTSIFDNGLNLDMKSFVKPQLTSTTIWKRRTQVMETPPGPKIHVLDDKMAMAKRKLQQLSQKPTVVVDEENGGLKLNKPITNYGGSRRDHAKTALSNPRVATAGECMRNNISIIEEITTKRDAHPPGTASSSVKRSKAAVAFGSTIKPQTDPLTRSPMGRYQQSPDSLGGLGSTSSQANQDISNEKRADGKNVIVIPKQKLTTGDLQSGFSGEASAAAPGKGAPVISAWGNAGQLLMTSKAAKQNRFETASASDQPHHNTAVQKMQLKKFKNMFD